MVLAGLDRQHLPPTMTLLMSQGQLLEALTEFRDPTPQTIYTVMLPERHLLPRVRAVVDFLAGLLAE